MVKINRYITELQGIINITHKGVAKSIPFKVSDPTSILVEVPIILEYTPNATAKVTLIGKAFRKNAKGAFDKDAPMTPIYGVSDVSIPVSRVSIF